MKKLFSLVAATLLAVGAYADSYTVAANCTGEVQMENVKVTFLNNTSKGSTADAGTWSFSAGKAQADQNSCEIKFEPTAAGKLTITFAAALAYNKPVVMFVDGDTGTTLDATRTSDEKVLQSGVSFGSSSDGNIVEQNGSIYYTLEAGKTYNFYGSGTKYAVKSFSYEELPTTIATAPTFDPQGGDVIAFSKITLSSDGTVYYQWQDAETTLTKDSEGWKAGSTVEVPNITGTKYLYAYATNGDGLESDVVSQVYNISEITLTAVTEKTWDFTTGWQTGDVSSLLFQDNIIVNGGDSRGVKIDGSKGVYTGGAPNSVNERNITFKVAPRSRITISSACSGNNQTRNLNICKDDLNTQLGVAVIDNTETIETTVDYTGNEDVTLIIYSNNGGGLYISKIEVEPLPTETKEVTEAGWATYIPTSNALFEDGAAYVVTAVTANVEIEGVTAVPAGTPVLLKDEGEKTITLTTATIEAPEKNLLKVYDGEQEGKVAYVLAKDEVNGAGFKKWIGEASVLTDRAVLWLGETQAARSFFALDGEATGIETVAPAATQEGAVYDLQGRRVAQPKAGLYIVNGKKVVLK